MSHNMFIHIGLIKTATTTLQKHYFNKHEDIYYLGKPTDDTILYEAVNHICRADGMNYDADFVKSQLEPILQAAKSSGKVIGMSDEKFTMHHRADRKLIAERMRDSFGPNIKIVLTIRKQKSVLDSLYLLEQRNAEHSNAIVKPKIWLQHQIDNNGILQTLDYYSLYKLYASVFGKENIKILLFEKFLEDRSAFLKELSDFCGIDSQEELLKAGKQENSRFSRRWLMFAWIKKALFGEYIVKGTRKLMPSIFLRLFSKFIYGGGGAKVNMPAIITHSFNNLYVEGNQKLSKELGINLGDFGYPVENVEIVKGRVSFDNTLVPYATWLPSHYSRQET